MGFERPEQPAFALMVDHNGSIVPVRLEYVADKIQMGWFLVASEDAALMPRPADAPPQSNPRRHVDVDYWREDGA